MRLRKSCSSILCTSARPLDTPTTTPSLSKSAIRHSLLKGNNCNALSPERCSRFRTLSCPLQVHRGGHTCCSGSHQHQARRISAIVFQPYTEWNRRPNMFQIVYINSLPASKFQKFKSTSFCFKTQTRWSMSAFSLFQNLVCLVFLSFKRHDFRGI